MADIRVVICWSDISGYMGACWRELSARPGVKLSVIAFGPTISDPSAPFDASVIASVDCQLLTPAERGQADAVAEKVIAKSPDVIVLCGWAHRCYVALASNPKLAKCKFVLTLDTPFKNNLRQRLGRLMMRRFFARMDAAIVAGERSANLAAYLGIDPKRICRGMYAIDLDALSAAGELRAQRHPNWPRKFVYVGRYVPEKGIDTLLSAYQTYRQTIRSAGQEPWELNCCGKGPLQNLLQSAEGVRDIGFVQPGQLPGVLADQGVLVLPSRYEPWGAALAEACAAGLPVIATTQCGASLDVLRSFHNGLLIGADDPVGLSRAMVWIHRNESALPEMGQRSAQLAEAFSAQRWADRWNDVFESIT